MFDVIKYKYSSRGKKAIHIYLVNVQLKITNLHSQKNMKSTEKLSQLQQNVVYFYAFLTMSTQTILSPDEKLHHRKDTCML